MGYRTRVSPWGGRVVPLGRGTAVVGLILRAILKKNTVQDPPAAACGRKP
jgi:hypothetical protein